MNNDRTGTIYLVVKADPQWRYGLKVDKATNKKPRSTPEGSIVVKLKLQIPRRAFEPVEPEAVLVVPESHVEHPIHVETVEPDQREEALAAIAPEGGYTSEDF